MYLALAKAAHGGDPERISSALRQDKCHNNRRLYYPLGRKTIIARKLYVRASSVSNLSFVACEHRFVLWLYGPLEHNVPPGVEIRDAAQIVPRDRVFCYKAGMRPGSYAGFSDLFRYKLLYDLGGWWSDLDAVCLRPLDLDAWYAFHPHNDLGLVGSVLKAPPKCELMRECAVWTARNVDAWNVVWERPIRILVAEVKRLGLGGYVLSPQAALANWREGEKYATTAAPLPPGLHVLHWCNEWLAARGFDKNAPIPGTTYHALLQSHGLL